MSNRALPAFNVTGNLHDLTGIVTATPDVRLVFTPILSRNPVVWAGDMYAVKPVGVAINSDGSIATPANPILLLANDSGLNVTELRWQVVIHAQGDVTTWSFPAPLDGQTTNLAATIPTPDRSEFVT